MIRRTLIVALFLLIGALPHAQAAVTSASLSNTTIPFETIGTPTGTTVQYSLNVEGNFELDIHRLQNVIDRGILVHTNHFLSVPGAWGDRENVIGPDSFFRYEILRRRLRDIEPASAADLIAALCSHFGGRADRQHLHAAGSSVRAARRNRGGRIIFEI